MTDSIICPTLFDTFVLDSHDVPFVFFLDLMQGIPVTEDLYSIFTKEKEHEALHKENLRSHQELISQLLQSYMKLLLPDDEKFHGGWALIDCDPRYAECARVIILI